MNTIFRTIVLISIFSCVSLSLFAQNVKVTGTITDANDQAGLVGATVLLINAQDSTKRVGMVTNAKGEFAFDNMALGAYRLRVSYLGFKKYEQRVLLRRNGNPALGNIALVPDANTLKDVTVLGKMQRVEQKGDTVQYNASAFKTNPDANAEDLIAKMPNITIENGKVKAQGEEVKKVTVDGREFFGDDATLALRNLPAEIVDKIQVFDRLSDQAQFTGFDDGQSSKSINIVTRGDRNNGQFGKLYAGYGSDNRYAAGGSTNFFKKDTRFSVIGQTNNINQQNFATQDLLGALGGTGGGGGRGGPGGGGRGGNGGGGPGGGGGGGNNADNFLINQQGGISTTHALGFNYSDNWGKKTKVTGSYFFNNANNANTTDVARTYFSTRGASQLYDEDYYSSNKNDNHRANFRIEYTLDKNNSFVISPRLSTQNNNALSSMFGVTSIADKRINQIQNDNKSGNEGYNFSNNILWRHRFAKNGRTLSTGLTTSYNDKTGEAFVKSRSVYFNQKDSLQLTDQRTDSENNGYTLSGNLNYTEQIGKTTQLQLSYNPSYNHNLSDRQTFTLGAGKEYSVVDNRLSNQFDNTYITNRLGTGLRFRINQMSFLMLDLNYQNAQLSGKQLSPLKFEVNRTFNNFLPSVMWSWRKGNSKSLRFNYRTSTNAPSISQLQNVVDNSNPLFLRTGNTDLKQEFTHSFSSRYGITNAVSAKSFFINLFGTYTTNNISTATYIADRDTSIAGFTLKRGSQLSRPVNVNGANWNIRTFIAYGVPFTPLKSNLNFNAGVSYSKVYGIINKVEGASNNTTVNGGLVLSSSQSEKFDYTVSYSANYNIVSNTLQPALNGNYYFQNTNLKLNWLTKSGFFLNTNTTHTLYTGLGQGFNQSFWLWNASAGYKFMKRQAGELKLSVFDVLHQNNSVSRNVTETYIEDVISQVVQRYFMLTFTYSIRNFRSGVTNSPAPNFRERGGDFGGGFRERGQ